MLRIGDPLVDFFGEAGEDVAMVAVADDEGMLVE
jgi:hypothetical protein